MENKAGCEDAEGGRRRHAARREEVRAAARRKRPMRRDAAQASGMEKLVAEKKINFNFLPTSKVSRLRGKRLYNFFWKYTHCYIIIKILTNNRCMSFHVTIGQLVVCKNWHVFLFV